MTCGYKDKGCAKGAGCKKEYGDCGLARYFDWLVARSDECRNNLLKESDYVAAWRMREKIDPRCEGCDKATDGGYCSVFVKPGLKWPDGEPSFDNKCFMATHFKPAKKKTGFVNPLKLSKRRNRR